MIFQKFLISLTLSAVVTPGVLQTTNPIKTTQKANPASSNLKDVNPFDPIALNQTYQMGDDYYAYYKYYAFMPVHSTHGWGDQYGYVMKLGAGSMQYMIRAYSYGAAHGYANGGLITYLINAPNYWTPWGNWIGWSHYHADTNTQEQESVSKGFAATTQDVHTFVYNAIQTNQRIDFYIWTESTYSVLHDIYWTKVMMANETTQATLTTAWYEG